MTTDAAPAIQSDFFSRNRGLLSAGDQAILLQSTVAIAGAGGDGGLLAERLVRAGIGHIILADPEDFEPANINRQFAAGTHTLGCNKAAAVAAELRRINPDLRATIHTEGITPENVAAIAGAAHVVVDEIEYSMPALSVLLHRAARAAGRHVFMGANIGWGASAFCFAPDGVSFEEHFGWNEATGAIDPLRYLKAVPSCFSPAIQQEILSGAVPMPSVAPAVSLAAAMLSTSILLFLTGRKAPLLMPRFLTIDLFDQTLCNQ